MTDDQRAEAGPRAASAAAAFPDDNPWAQPASPLPPPEAISTSATDPIKAAQGVPQEPKRDAPSTDSAGPSAAPPPLSTHPTSSLSASPTSPSPTSPVKPANSAPPPAPAIPTTSSPSSPVLPTKTAEPPASSASVTLQSLTDRALHFLSTASNETLSACLVGLGATTYLVLGRVGLVLMGVMSGVVLHATWEGGSGNLEGTATGMDPKARQKETGLDIVKRVLDWRAKGEAAAAGAEERGFEKNREGKEVVVGYTDFKPETAAALEELTEAIIRDYVKWWYTPILPQEQTFPNASRQTLTHFIRSIGTHLSRKRPADTFLEFVTNSSSIIIVFLSELSAALAASPSAPPAGAVDAYLEQNPDSNLAHVLDRHHQEKKLDMVADDVLQNFLERGTLRCRPAHVFLREILAKVVLEMTIETCSKPEWINGWIVYLLEDGEPELMNAIDAGVGGSTGKELQSVKTQVLQKEVQQHELPAERSPHAQQQTRLSVDDEAKKDIRHKRVVSKAQEAMDDAMQEAKRLTQMIAEEEARRVREQQQAATHTPAASTLSLGDDASEGTNHDVVTPTSSQSDAAHPGEGEQGIPRNMSMESARQENTHQAASGDEKRPETPKKGAFTSFDQLVPQQQPTALVNTPNTDPAPPLTLYNCNISIFDDSMPGEKGALRSKPNIDYLIQIEPASRHHTGWMIARKHADFETLHEILRRISTISGAGFTEAHANLPAWKGRTKAQLREDLERYLNDAVRLRPLAESEGMRRFLEKERGLEKTPGGSTKGNGAGGFPGLGWPNPSAFENMGKGMMDALTKAPKEVAGGGKALLGGVTGVFGGVQGALGGQKKGSGASTPESKLGRSMTSLSGFEGQPIERAADLPVAAPPVTRAATASVAEWDGGTGAGRAEGTEASRPMSAQTRPEDDWKAAGQRKQSQETSRPASLRESMETASSRHSVGASAGTVDHSPMRLPPLPSDIPDDYGASPPRGSRRRDSNDSSRFSREPTVTVPVGDDTTSMTGIREEKATSPQKAHSAAAASPTTTTRTPHPKPSTKDTPISPSKPPLTEQETQVAVELIFAVINELYTLSSAWQIRRTLLNAAKTFLLRPGNPQLDSIRSLLQTTVLDANASDAGIAAHVRALRAGALPTEEERNSWPAEMGEEEKERLRVKARRLLVERGMPPALTGVMGMAASGEALGKVFDCLQVVPVARALIFGMMLQGMRAVTQ
ncbi:PXA domain-containing protein [Lineolata rhizophorae]|uniref:PXA domain-containing protein n=1 Tax=Lineolata rhizophorae TaxID=578093 RepID=A0A6A6P118_9PEZI|nr:PXA domain-containing protein [Lineolata rhizophorae]